MVITFPTAAQVAVSSIPAFVLRTHVNADMLNYEGSLIAIFDPAKKATL